ncbi:MAG TPA: hypothetical protein VL021_00270 [Brumimicrobium sp.]|nr:hypothetical protein [Flavobacterium sp.]HTO36832.1 hypothetical protein [Brumimicrobium sp.]
MNEKLRQLENILEGQSNQTNFSQSELLIYPETFKQIHSYNLFGNDLLSIPANLIIEGDDDEFEKPFRFTDDFEEINLFESEFREEIPENFIQIGNLYGSTEIVLLNKLNDEIHIFNVSDIADNEWMKHKLENPICNLTTFLENIRPQTVCCLINPKDYSKYEILEIRNLNTIVTEEFEREFETTSEMWTEYFNIIRKAIDKGLEIHYAPKKIINELNSKSTNG